MTPDRQSDGGSTLAFIISCIAIGAKDAYDSISHKTLLVIFTAIIGVLSYWGFSTTLERLARIEVNQGVAKEEMINEIKNRLQGDLTHEKDIAIIRERQGVVIETLKDTNSTVKEIKDKLNGDKKK